MASEDDLKQFGVDESTRNIMQKDRNYSNSSAGERKKSSRKSMGGNKSTSLPQGTDDAMEILLTNNVISPAKSMTSRSPLRLSSRASDSKEELPVSGVLNDTPTSAKNLVADADFMTSPLIAPASVPTAEEDTVGKVGAFADKSLENGESETLTNVPSGGNGVAETSLITDEFEVQTKRSKRKSRARKEPEVTPTVNSENDQFVHAPDSTEPEGVPAAQPSIEENEILHDRVLDQYIEEDREATPPSAGAFYIEQRKSENDLYSFLASGDNIESTKIATDEPVSNVDSHGAPSRFEDDDDGERRSGRVTIATTQAHQDPSGSSHSSLNSEQRLAKDWEFKHRLPADLDVLVLKIDEFKKSFAAPSTVPLSLDGGHVRFRITRSLASDLEVSPQSVFRRFRDFQALSLRLRHCYPFLVIPSLPTLTLLSRIVMSAEEFLDLRARRLEAFLYTLLRDQTELWKSPDVQAFLIKESEEFDEMAVKYLKNSGQDLEVPPPAVTEKILNSSLSYLYRFVGSGSSTSAATGTNIDSKVKEALDASYTDVARFKDKGEEKDRVTLFEHLNECLEQQLSLSRSRVALLEQMQQTLDDVIGFPGLGDAAFNSQAEAEFAHALVKEPLPLNDSIESQGPLRSSHQCCALLGGANESYQTVQALIEQQNVQPADVEILSSEFRRVRQTVSRMGFDLAWEFVNESFSKAQKERARLENVLQSPLFRLDE